MLRPSHSPPAGSEGGNKLPLCAGDDRKIAMSAYRRTIAQLSARIQIRRQDTTAPDRKWALSD